MARLAFAALVAVVWSFSGDAVFAQADPCPGLQNTAEAIISPDKYAWQLFVELNTPVDPTTKCPDPGKPFGAEGTVVWEAWRNVRSGAADAVFPPMGADPGEWLSTPVVTARLESDMEPLRKQLVLTTLQNFGINGLQVAFDPVVGEGNEVRMNRAAFEFVRSNKLFDKREQMRLAGQGTALLAFPLAAKEVKATWRRIREQDKPRYHWAVVKDQNGNEEIWGLVGLHIITKDLPKWFWATFEHVDNKVENALPPGGGTPNEGWRLRSVDRYSCPKAPYDCEAIPKNIGIEGTKWENYRLRGTQVDFVTPAGRPTLLADSTIERGFQERSSCITCHSRATIDKDGKGAGFGLDAGVPNPDWFEDPATGAMRFMQNDFVFSLDRASESPN